ncbi:hypothetical protein [Vibrio phage vB_VmeM-Yong XC32]|nr:hypothetical protein [Vibrio phage vB_VmeM-Yong XC31]QAX96431.1 hypothetical protein [Vibrio phage vB_VmeM-Yong XC32]QAX96748.1 hypothetical protein [Vibrio phage vB_VmeM-Yong MS31]QAX97067.1 hypothetical protein [Vibrio phage vB_VmeM-Yong MS32]
MLSNIFTRLGKAIANFATALLVILSLGFFEPSAWARVETLQIAVDPVEPKIVEVEKVVVQEKVVEVPSRPRYDQPKVDANPNLNTKPYVREVKPQRASESPVIQLRPRSERQARKMAARNRVEEAMCHPTYQEFTRWDLDSVIPKGQNLEVGRGLLVTHLDDATIIVNIQPSAYIPRASAIGKNPDGHFEGSVDSYFLFGVANEDEQASPINHPDAKRCDLPRDHPFFGLPNGVIWGILGGEIPWNTDNPERFRKWNIDVNKLA